MEMTGDWWRCLRELGPWFVVEALLPGAALFALLLWLSQRFVREGFAPVRQHAFAPTADIVSVKASAQRNWWSCTCVDACTCLSRIVHGLRRRCLEGFSTRKRANHERRIATSGQA
jgi:hypothetical protein